jgi:hypothetical protein
MSESRTADIFGDWEYVYGKDLRWWHQPGDEVIAGC